MPAHRGTKALVGALLATSLFTVGATTAQAHSATTESFALLRECESGGDYRADSGNGYYGAYQFSAETWRAYGYAGMPHESTPEVQDEAAAALQAGQGWGAWPACSRKLGLG